MGLHILVRVVVVVLGLTFGATKKCGYTGSLKEGESYIIKSPILVTDSCRWILSSPINTTMELRCQTFSTRECKSKCIDHFFSPSDDFDDLDSKGYCGLKHNLTIGTKSNHFDAFFFPGSRNYYGYYNSETDCTDENVTPTSYQFDCEVSVMYHPPPKPGCVRCGRNNLKGRIVGGEEAKVHEWPWQVAIRGSNGRQFCGGSIISPSWVLTAAHCVPKGFGPLLHISIGEHALDTGADTNHTVNATVSQVIIHPNFTTEPMLYNDIALLRLSTPVEYSHGISPVCLPTKLQDQTFEYEKVTATGWGRTSWSTPSETENLLEVDLLVLPNSLCLAYRATNICAEGGKNGESIHGGDSGGPLVWLDENGRYQQIGISSFIRGKFRPSGYTRVTSYIDWIEENTNIQFCSAD